MWKTLDTSQPPTIEDVETIQAVCRAVSERAAVYIGIMLFSIWRLQRDTLLEDDKISQDGLEVSGLITIAYCGGVIEKHPTLRRRIQDILDLLIGQELQHTNISPDLRLVLEPATDSSLLGVAIASMMRSTEIHGQKMNH